MLICKFNISFFKKDMFMNNISKYKTQYEYNEI